MKTKKIFILFALVGLVLSGCMKDEIFQGPPVIGNLTLTPQAPSENQEVTVSAKVTDLNGLKMVTLFYKVGSENFVSVEMTGNDSGIFSAKIPGQASDVTVSYYIQAENQSGQKSVTRAGL